MLIIIIVGLSIYIVIETIKVLAISSSHQHSFSGLSFLLLCLIYGTILIAFGIWYVILHLNYGPILKGVEMGDNFFSILNECLYFSAATLFSVGYGDVVPVGIGKWLAIIEALIGYTLPAAFVVHSIKGRE